MNEVITFLEENKTGFMATIEGDKPRVRTFGYVFSEDNKLYFCTSNTKNVYQQMLEWPTVEFAVMSNDLNTLRVSGDICFTDDMRLKEKILEVAPHLKSLYQNASNPIFEVFCMHVKEAIFFDMSNTQPRRKEF